MLDQNLLGLRTAVVRELAARSLSSVSPIEAHRPRRQHRRPCNGVSETRDTEGGGSSPVRLLRAPSSVAGGTPVECLAGFDARETATAVRGRTIAQASRQRILRRHGPPRQLGRDLAAERVDQMRERSPIAPQQSAS